MLEQFPMLLLPLFPQLARSLTDAISSSLSFKKGSLDNVHPATLDYKKDFGKSRINALAGYTMQKKTYDRVGVEAKGFANDRIHEVTAHGTNASDISLYSTRKAAWALLSYFARLNWSYDGRYALTGTVRADGSSRFGVDNRYGFFPSVSAEIGALYRMSEDIEL